MYILVLTKNNYYECIYWNFSILRFSDSGRIRNAQEKRRCLVLNF